MHHFNNLFERLNYWRSFPGFQLERHIDVFLSFYLKELIYQHFKKERSDFKELSNFIIPEFPINQSLTIKSSNREISNNIDFILPSKDLKDIYFIEIKTDRKSRTQKQDKLMIQYGELSFQKILEGVINIAIKTNEKRKYATLLNNLENMGYITVPPEFWNLFSNKSLRGYGEIAPRIQVINSFKTRVVPIFIQPRKDGKNSTIDSIYFEEFAKMLENNSEDELGQILSKMLRKWSNDPDLIEFSKQSV